MSESQQAAALALEQARAEMNNDKPSAAVTLVRQAVGRADISPDQLAEAGRLGVNLGMEEAFGWFMRAGRRQIDEGNLTGARETFEAARALDEKNYEPIFELGRVEIATGNKAAGLGRFAEVLRKSHYTFVPALFEAGCVYEADDQVDQAILTFKRIVERDKNHAQALAHLGRLNRVKQLASEASQYLFAAAEAARKTMDYALALQCARDILEFDPGNARARGLESEMEKIAPEPRDRRPTQKEAPKAAPPPPPIAQVVAGVVPLDFKLIEQQSKATLELAQVTAAVAEAYKQRLAIEEQIKAAQTTLQSVAVARTGADQELLAIKAQLDNVAKARAAEEASLVALSKNLERGRDGLVAIEALHENVKQADEKAQAVAKTVEQLRSESAVVKERAEKAKTEAGAVERTLGDVVQSFSALRKNAEAAKAALDGAKAQADKVKADAVTAEAAIAAARGRFDVAKGQFDEVEKNIVEAAARAKAVGSDAVVTLNGLSEVESSISATAAAQKGIADAIAQLRALATALTERRKQTEAALAEIQGISEPQAAGLSDADVAKLEAGLAAAIEKAAAAARQTPPPAPAAAPAPAPAQTAPPQQPAAAAKPNGVAQTPAPAAAAKSAKGEAQKPPEKSPDKPGEKQAVAGAKAADDNSARAVFARGIAALEAHKPQDAIKLFEPLQANQEYTVLAQTAIGRCHQEMGQTDEAVQWYSKALETPAHPEEQYHEALYYMAAAHASRDDDESRELAVWALEEVAAANPGYRDVKARLESLKAKAGKAPTSGPA